MRRFVKSYAVDKLVPGMILANALVTTEGGVLLSEKTRLNLAMIEGLKCHGIICADILHESDDSNSFERLSRFDGFIRMHENAVQSLRSVYMQADSLKRVGAEEVDALVNGELTSMLRTPGVLEFIHLVKCRDEYTYTHSLNVSLLSGLLCKWIDAPNIEEAMTAGLLHDIGKVLVQRSLLNKAGKLTNDEMSQLRQHSQLGWKLCSTGGGFSENVLTGVLSHHERLDGSGYPRQLRDGDISLLAKIIAIVDVYDAMSSNRAYQLAKNQFEILEEIYAEMFCRLDPQLSYIFIKNMKELLIGSSVLLKSGTRGKLLLIDGVGPCRTMIQDTDGNCSWLDSPGTQIAEVS